MSRSTRLRPVYVYVQTIAASMALSEIAYFSEMKPITMDFVPIDSTAFVINRFESPLREAVQPDGTPGELYPDSLLTISHTTEFCRHTTSAADYNVAGQPVATTLSSEAGTLASRPPGKASASACNLDVQVLRGAALVL